MAEKEIPIYVGDIIPSIASYQRAIDIYEKGKNKAQVLDEIKGSISFFGDKMDIGGNDYPIAERLATEKRKYNLFKVKNPKETWDILKNIH